MNDSPFSLISRAQGRHAGGEDPKERTLGVPPEADAETMRQLRQLVLEKKGIDLHLYTDSYLQRRIAAWRRNKGCTTVEEFVRLLAADSREIDLFLESFIVRVTEFFRSPRTFETMEQKTLPALFGQKKKDLSHVVRAWSAGCSSGEEPYSLAILFRECLKKEKERFSVLIFATDIDEKSLMAARKGFFEAAKLAKTRGDWKENYFQRSGDGYAIRDEIRRMVVFRAHNLKDPPPFRNLDLILFRNVLIYINPEAQRHLLTSFFEALNPGGYLVLGRTEGGVGALPPQFLVADAGERIYQRPLEEGGFIRMEGQPRKI